MQKIRKKTDEPIPRSCVANGWTNGRTDERTDERMNGGAEQKSYDTSLSAGLQ